MHRKEEAVQLFVGVLIVILTLLLVIPMAFGPLPAGGSLGQAWWYQVDFYADHASEAHVYLPLVMRSYRPPPPPPVYPNDPYYSSYYSSQWGLSKIRAPEAWALSRGTGVLIAVLDTGTDYSHPDLSGKVRIDIDRDYINGDKDAMDDNGHGTHVAGIAAAATNNSQGVAGLGWEATILPLKVMAANGSGTTDQLIPAIYYAADQGAKVVNMSLGGAGSCPEDLRVAVDYAYSRGVLLVAAAGNNGANVSIFPANCTHVLGVAATTLSDTRASFSNYGAHVSVAAPGTSIYSTLPGGYGYMQGTSMATPFVAGLAALVYARFPSYTPDQVASAILDNAQDLGTTGWDPYYGCGRIDAFRSLWDGARGDYPVCLGARVWGEGAEEGRGGGAGEAVPGELVVTVRAGARAEALFRAQGLASGGKLLYQDRSGTQVWHLRVPVGQETAVLARLRADPAVLAADRNYVISAQP